MKGCIDRRSMKNYKVNLQNGFVVKANNEEDAVKWVFQTLILYGGYDVGEYLDGDVKDDGEEIPIVYDYPDFYETIEI